MDLSMSAGFEDWLASQPLHRERSSRTDANLERSALSSRASLRCFGREATALRTVCLVRAMATGSYEVDGIPISL